MPSLPRRKVGIVACSGEELAEGTVTRLAALKVLHELRRGRTVTICLPLFLAGGEDDRTFARFHPTITVDGCDLKCAAHGTETYSGKPAASIVVSEIAAQHGLAPIEGRRCLNQAGQKAVELTAARLCALVDQLLRKGAPQEVRDRGEETSDSDNSEVVACSCGSGIPVKVLTIAGRSVEVIALPLILERVQKAHASADDAALQELLDLVKIYNDVAPEEEPAWRMVLMREFAAHCNREVPG